MTFAYDIIVYIHNIIATASHMIMKAHDTTKSRHNSNNTKQLPGISKGVQYFYLKKCGIYVGILFFQVLRPEVKVI